MTRETSALPKRVFDDVLGDPAPTPGASLRVKAKLRRRVLTARRRRSLMGAGLVVGLATLSAVVVTRALPSQTAAQKIEAVVPGVASLGAPLSEGLIEFPSGARVSIASGSVVHLISDDAQGTTLRVTRGELLAQVETRSSSRPFLVLADEVEVRVVGTTFVVASDTHYGVRVRGYEGRVWVSKGSERVVVGAGDLWPANVAPLPMIDRPGIAERLHLEAELLEASTVLQPEDSTTGNSSGAIVDAREPEQALQGAVSDHSTAQAVEASFAEALALEREGRDVRALARYRKVSATRGSAQEDALFAVARLLRTRLQRSKEALSAFEDYRKRFPEGRYAQAADVHILDLVVASQDWERVEKEANRFLSVRARDPRAAHFRLARIKARLRRGDCAGLAEDLAATPAALELPGLATSCPNAQP